MTLTSENCTAEIRISTPSKRVAHSICASLSPDLSTIPDGRRDQIRVQGSRVVISISSRDIASLRAALNSSLLLAEASFRCIAL